MIQEMTEERYVRCYVVACTFQYKFMQVQIKDKIILESLAKKGNYVFFAKNSLTQRLK